MRIIITKNGKYIIQEMDNETTPIRYQKISRNRFPSLYKRKSINNISEYLRLNKKKLSWGQNPPSRKSVSQNNSMNNFFSRDVSKINSSELNKAKKVKLAKKKLNISQNLLDRYYDADDAYKMKLSNFANELKRKQNKKNDSEMQEEKKDFFEFAKNTNNNSQIKKRILLSEIISKMNLKILKHQISKQNTGYDDTRLPLNDTNKDSFNFRSKFEDKKLTLNNLKILLNIPINPDRKDLINYFKQQKEIRPHYFENFLKYDEQQIYKLNKICQLIFDQKENAKKINEYLKEKKINEEKLAKDKGMNSIMYVDKLMHETNGIIGSYERYKENCKNKRNKIFKEQVRKIKNNYWDRYEVDKFLKEEQKQKKLGEDYSKSSFDYEEIFNKTRNNIKLSKSTPNIFEKK